ncbi:MAG: hypothetical protein AAF616_10415 [Bacteroidota bacterium]
MKGVSRYVMSGFYVLAGINHFINPEFYYPLIPEYFRYPIAINFLSGVAEVTLGLGLLWSKTRKVSAYLIIAMLFAFIPSHIYFIEIGGCIDEGLCAAPWVGWVRLLIIHPLLMYWAWRVRK